MALKKTARNYSFLWGRNRPLPVPKWHFCYMQEALGEPIVRGRIGIDVGSGCGYDTNIIAKNNPSVKIVSVDISDGVYVSKKLNSQLKNVNIIKNSILDMPIKNGIFDFAYSFGALHHTTDPEKGLLEINRILKAGCPVFLYLYEDHSDNILKYGAVKIVARLRFLSTKLPPSALYFLCCLFSPFVFFIFTLPANFLRIFKPYAGIADSFPFNFCTSPFSVRGDLYDRFSVPIEHRFSKTGIQNVFLRSGFDNPYITRLKNAAGWVVKAYKK